MAKCSKCDSRSFKMEIIEVHDSVKLFRAISCSKCDTVVSFLDYTNSTIAFDKIANAMRIKLDEQ